jgi:predicted ATPase/DNA-binding CsgD family transcriptional regulator
MNDPAGRTQAERPSSSVPTPLTRMVGRQQELSAGTAMLRDRQVRLVTLTGAPGTGKTRLALGLCHAVVDNFPDGIWFVPLAGLDRADLVLSTIAQHLGVHQVARRPLIEALRRVLEGQRLLLVLDNFEHLLPAASHVVELLEACAGMTVLVTSRAPLRVSGEHRFRVPPLEVPRLEALPGLKALSQIPAVHLFVQRARAVRREFALTEHNAVAVAELTVRLDGLPLAIELAAARGAVLDQWQLLGRLGGRLALLADGPHDLPDRQRTLDAAIRWSYDLLTPREQRVFRRLAVFASGCTLEAAEAVVAEVDNPPNDALGAITSLLEQSLLQQVHPADGDLRLALSETIREYALGELTASGELDLVRQQHARYYARFAERLANPQLDVPDGPALMIAGDRDHDNLRTALRWHVDRGDADASVRLAGALWSFWEKRGHWAEGLQWLQTALALPGNADLSARAEALIGLAILHRERSEFPAAASAGKEALRLRRHLGSNRVSLMVADMVAMAGDPDTGATLAAEALAQRHVEGDPLAIAWAELVCGHIAAYRADFSGAREHFELGLAARREREGENEVDANLWHGLGTMLAGSGAIAAGQPLVEQALALFRARGETRGVARAQLSLGALLARSGDHAPARVMLDESLALFRQLGEGVGIAICSLLLGPGLATGMLSEIGEDAVRMFARLHLARDMPPLTDIAAWRIVQDRPSASAHWEGAPDALTPRELEILKLLAQRYSNQEIADQLNVSVRTVERHIANVYAKNRHAQTPRGRQLRSSAGTVHKYQPRLGLNDIPTSAHGSSRARCGFDQRKNCRPPFQSPGGPGSGRSLLSKAEAERYLRLTTQFLRMCIRSTAPRLA